jgi:hypothetical protein
MRDPPKHQSASRCRMPHGAIGMPFAYRPTDPPGKEIPEPYLGLYCQDGGGVYPFSGGKVFNIYPGGKATLA